MDRPPLRPTGSAPAAAAGVAPPAPPPPATDARTRILDAAEAIVQSRGVPALTLDAAAREAGVSKGGLLYHFASKEALLAGMLARLSAWFRAEFESCVGAQAPGPGRVARAMLAWSLGEDEHACNERHERAAAVFLAVHHHDPAMLDPVRAVVAEIKRAVASDGLPPGHGHVIMAACDGLFFYRIFGLVRFEEAERAAMRAALARLAAAAPEEAAP